MAAIGEAVPGALHLREWIAAVADRHGLAPGPWPPVARSGATATVYLLPEAALKVAHAGDLAGEGVRREAAVAPVALAAGVRVPRLLAFDDGGGELPTPSAIFERVRGEPLANLGAKRPVSAAAWRALGRDLALVHDRVDPGGIPALVGLPRFAQTPDLDPRPWAEAAASAGHVGRTDAALLVDVLDRLAPAALAPIAPRWCHGDVNADNVLVGPSDLAYAALVDWAGSGWIDPAWVFVPVPRFAVPHMLAGHREVSPLPADETADARILWCRLQYVLFRLRDERPGSPEGRRRARRLVAEAKHHGAKADSHAGGRA